MRFSYKAIKQDKVVAGYIEDKSQERALQNLRRQNMTVVSLKEKGMPLSETIKAVIGHVTFNDVVNFTRQLAIMLNSGLTLVESLDILRQQTTKAAILKMLTRVSEDVRAGQSLSSALQKNQPLFSNLYISLVKAGEASGKLDEILLKLADNLEKQRALKGKVKGALIYPAIIVVGMLIVMFVMMTFVLPQLLNLYKDFDVPLPIVTRILIAVSTIFQKFWVLILIGAAGFVLALRQYLTTKRGRKMLDGLLLRLPLMKNVIQMSTLVDTTRTLSVLIGAGVSILETLDIIVETSGNIIYKEAFGDIYKKVEKGQTLGQSLEQAGIFPVILVQMVIVGEQTGHLDETLMRISRYFEMESEIAIKAMTTLIEPLVLVVLGVGVGFLVLSVITPIYNLTGSFG